MKSVEQPDYTVVASKGNIEIRDYSPLILAEVAVGGERKEAIREGFKILADYIFGNNTYQQHSEKIAMTAPVMQEQVGSRWKVRFVMPKKYRLETLPKPHSQEIVFIPLPGKRFAVIRFSGFADDENIERYTHQLKAYLAEEQVTAIGESVLAFYNPPWTLPFLRRNEIMVEIQS